MGISRVGILRVGVIPDGVYIALHINSPYKTRTIEYLTIVLMYFILIISGLATSLARPSTKRELSWKKKFLGI